MTRFRVHAQALPRPDVTAEQRADFRQREYAALIDLVRRGVLRRMLRCARANMNYSIWEAESLETLDAAIRSLPAFSSGLNVATVTPLVRHPIEEAYEQEHGPVPSL